MNWRRIITIIILVLQLVAVLIPTLAHEARFPSSLSAQDIGQWFGGIYRYWREVFVGAIQAVTEGTTE